MPHCFPCGCFDPIRHQIGCDLPDTVSQQEPGEDAPDNGRLLRIDLRLAIRTPAVAEEVFTVVIDLSVLEVLPVAPPYIAAEGFASRLAWLIMKVSIISLSMNRVFTFSFSK